MADIHDIPWRERVIENRSRPGWLTGTMLELAILNTLQRANQPLDWAEIVTRGPLDHCSTSADRNSAIAALVGRGDVLTETIPKPGEMWSRITVYYLPQLPREGARS